MRSWALLIGSVVGFSVAVASCSPAPKPCGPSTCNGCCDSAGECLAGTAVFECGLGGGACMACRPNELCRAGACETFDGGEYDASFPGARDGSINYDAGLFDGGPEVDAGRDAGRPDSGVTDAGRGDGGPPVSFMNDLVPIFSGNCVSCHANRASYADVRARVVPNNAPGSLIYQKITGTQSSGSPMPPGGQLSTTNPAGTALIERWIQQGALNN